MLKIFQVIKGLLITQENTQTPKEIEIIPGGTADTKTTITSSQTVDRTVTIPDDTTTLLGTATAQNVSNKTITDSTLNNSPVGNVTPSTGDFTDLTATSAEVNGDPVVTEVATQTLKNKSLEDTTTTITDFTDPTIQLRFDAAGTTATSTTLLGSQTANRILTLPDATDTLVGRDTTDTLTNKTITGATLTGASISGGTIDNTPIGQTTPAAADFTTVDTTSDLTVGGNAVVQGDLTVNGTTVTLNTTNLNVEDKNITVNFGGNDASAEGAGLTVDRTGTEGSLIYKDASATKFAAGALGSEVDLVGTTSTQTLSNKSLEDSTTAIVDSVDPTKQIKFDAAGTTATNTTILSSQTTNKILTLPDATDTLVGKATTDTLTNKTLQFLQQTTATNAALTGSDQTLNTITTGIVRLTNASLVSIAGISAGVSGQSLTVENKTGSILTVANESASASASDRILTGTSGTVTMLPDATFIFTYDSTSARWQLTGGSGSGSGGSGGVNFITAGDAESTNPYVGYTYGATAKPVVPGILGAGGYTTAISSSTPLAGNNSFLLTKTVSSVTTGASQDIPFTVSPAYRAKANTIEFDYQLVSGTFQVGTPTQDSEIIIYIYDIDNNVMIEPSNYKLLSNSTTNSEKFSAQFQTSATSLNYRLMFYMGTANAVQWSLKVDNIKVGPSQYVYGNPQLDTISYTSTLTNFGTATSTFTYVKDGDRLFGEGRILIGATPPTGALKFTLPPGLSIDYSKTPVASGNNYQVGEATAFRNTTAGTDVGKVMVDPTLPTNTFQITGDDSVGMWNATTPITFSSATTDTIFVKFNVPITGWSSSVQMSDQTDTRVVGSKAGKTSAQSIPNSTWTIVTNWNVLDFDTHGAFNSTAGVYTVPVSGYYTVNAQITYANNGAGNRFIQINKNNESVASPRVATISNTSTGEISVQASSTDLYYAGDTIRVYGLQTSGGSLNTSANGGYNLFDVTRLSGPSAIAASETVAASYYLSANQTTAAQINFNTKEFDTHNAVTTGVGAWKFTAPTSGIYSISIVTSQTAGTTNVNVYKNGTVNKPTHASTSGGGFSSGSLRMRLVAGDFIDFRPSASVTIVGGGVDSGSHVSIQRVGL